MLLAALSCVSWGWYDMICCVFHVLQTIFFWVVPSHCFFCLETNGLFGKKISHSDLFRYLLVSGSFHHQIFQYLKTTSTPPFLRCRRCTHPAQQCCEERAFRRGPTTQRGSGVLTSSVVLHESWPFIGEKQTPAKNHGKPGFCSLFFLPRKTNGWLSCIFSLEVVFLWTLGLLLTHFALRQCQDPQDWLQMRFKPSKECFWPAKTKPKRPLSYANPQKPKKNELQTPKKRNPSFFSFEETRKIPSAAS